MFYSIFYHVHLKPSVGLFIYLIPWNIPWNIYWITYPNSEQKQATQSCPSL